MRRISTFLAALLFAASALAQSLPSPQLRFQISATDFAGVDPTGVGDSTAGLLNAIIRLNSVATANGLAVLRLPCGSYKVSGTLTLSHSNTGMIADAKSCVEFLRSTNYGPTIRVANASGPIYNITLRDLWSTDLSTLSGSAGFMSCATSPYHFVVDGVGNLDFDNIQATGGCGHSLFNSVNGGRIDHPTFNTQQISGHAEETALGTGLYFGVTANANVTWGASTNIFLNEPEIEGGASYAAIKLFDGIRVDGIDGIWITSGHVQATTNADLRIAHNGASSQFNINVQNTMLDIGSGAGLKLDGSKQVERLKIDAAISAAGAYPASASNGVLVTGSGGVNKGEFNISVDGYGAHGLYWDATNSSNIRINPKTFTNNGLQASSTYDDIHIVTPQNVTISGGNLNSTAVANEIFVGAFVNIATVVGVNMVGNIGRPATIAAGASKYTFVGNTCFGNIAGITINDLGGAVPKTITGNTGC